MAPDGLQFRKIELLVEDLERLPTLPGVACRLLPLVCGPQLAWREILEVIESDPVLTCRMLALANEPADGEPPVGTVEKAVDRLGRDTVIQDLMAPEVYEGVEGETLVGFWRHSLATAIVSQMLAMRLGDIDPNEALTAGLLHDIGRLVLAHLLPRGYKQVLEQVQASGSDIIDVEQKVLGIDHLVVGKRLADRWNFPEPLVAAIWLHHQTSLPKQDVTTRLVQVVYLADLIANRDRFEFGHLPVKMAPGADIAEQLGIAADEVERLGHRLAQTFQSNARAAGISGPHETQLYYRALGQANRRLGRLNIATARSQRELTYRLHRSELLMKAGSELATCRKPREVMETVAAVSQQALGSDTVVVYSLGAGLAYIEGVRFGPKGRCEEHFFYETADEAALETVPWQSTGGAVVMRAERVEGWLFERMGPALGRGPFFTVPMMADGAKVGGLVFSKGNAPVDQRAADELSALGAMAALALKRAQAEASLVRKTEELTESNRRLQQAQEELLLRRSMATVGEMAAGAAHEINNPLAVISGRAQQLLAEEKEEKRRTMLESIASSAERASDIVRELREFARPARPKPQLAIPADILSRAAAAFGPVVESADISLKVEAVDDIPAIRVDSEQVVSAISEVVQNAVDACKKGGHITLSVEHLEVGGLVRFRVGDDGAGMDAETAAKAFDPFFSGYEAGRKRGLGLSKAYRLIEANGGRITLESTPGRGTDVWITFPAAPAQAEDSGTEVNE